MEFCSLVTDVYGQAPGGSASFSGDTCGGLNLISALGCEAYAEAGLEDYYAVTLNAGQTLTATMTSTADGACGWWKSVRLPWAPSPAWPTRTTP